MRESKFSKIFEKKVNKLKGQEFENVQNKINEILECLDLNHYKNLKHDLKKFKRVHVNTSYVIIFYDDLNNIVYFHNYAHHDDIYKNKGIQDKFKLLIRISKDLQFLPFNQYTLVIEKSEIIGKLLGGLLKKYQTDL